MSRRRRPASRERPLIVHLTTTDISLALLLGGQLKAFADSDLDVMGASAPGPFVADIECDGIRHLPLRHATRSMSVTADARAALELWRLIRELRPDVLHTHNPKPGFYGRIVGRLAGVPGVVNTVHGLYATPEDRWRKRAVVYSLERFAAFFSDAELVQNQEDLAVLRRLRVRERQLRLLGNGIDLKRFSNDSLEHDARSRIRAELGATNGSVVVTSVGRLVREKGFPELFAAAARLQQTHPQVLFAVAGPMDPSKSDAISESDLDQARRAGVRLLGHRTDVDAIYAASDVFVLASHREGFPRSAMEASAMGLPVVATDVRGCRQVVEHGRTGLLTPVGNPSALAAAIAHLVDDAPLRREMGQLGAAKARVDFDQDSVIRITLDVYRDVLSRRR